MTFAKTTFGKTKARFFLIAGLLFSSAFLVSASQAQILTSCWQASADPDETVNCAGQNKICIEWEEDIGAGMTTTVTATTCCSAEELGGLGCSFSCRSLARPLVIGHVPMPGLPVAPEALALKIEPEAAPIQPLLAVHFEGRVYEGEEMSRLANRTLHYLFLLDDGSGESALHAVTDRAEIDSLIRELSRPQPIDLQKIAYFPEGGGVSLFADEGWQNANYFLPAGSGVDFKEGWWAGKVSSLRGTGAPTWVTLFAGAGYSGSSLTLSTAWDRPNLVAFGFDDQIRSAYVWPRQDRGGVNLVKPKF